MFGIPLDVVAGVAASNAVDVARKQQLLDAKKGSSSGGGFWNFASQVVGAYQQSKAPPATTAPAPGGNSLVPSSPASPSSGAFPWVVIGGAALVGFLVLRRR